MSMAAADTTALARRIRALAREKNAVILAHNYQIGPVQDVADFVGDSLGLSRQAARTKAHLIVFCGVHFMAETASILCPGKRVLIPDLEAGCSLSDTLSAQQLAAWKAQYPDAVVVTYVNTSAAVKALSDYCCTSSNAVEVIRAIPEEKPILFGPDMFLGAYASRVTGRKNLHIWAGECHVHAAVRPEDVERAREAHPGADFLIHPECGCVTSCMVYLKDKDLKQEDAYITSTEGMVNHVACSPKREFVVATETGILHRMRKESPGKEYFPVSNEMECRFMKMITLEKLLHSLEAGVHEVKVPPEIADRARLPIERMIAIGRGGGKD
ncbi:MAG: quinolinate synthase NadA [Acidobacteriota bacterium]